MNKPTRADYTSVLNFMENRSPQLYAKEQEFIYHKDDLVALRLGRENAWLDVIVERMLRFFHCSIVNVGMIDDAI